MLSVFLTLSDMKMPTWQRIDGASDHQQAQYSMREKKNPVRNWILPTTTQVSLEHILLQFSLQIS